MSNILISTPPTSLATGLLQLDGGVAISSTPVYVADQNNTDSVLSLSTVNVGIGTTSPSYLLDVNGIGRFSGGYQTPVAIFERNADYGQVITLGRKGVSADAGIGYPADSTLGFYTASTERMRILINGNVGIGTTSATGRLSVKGSGSTSATTTMLIQNSSGNNTITTTDDGSTIMYANISTSTAPLIVNNQSGWSGSFVQRIQTWRSAGSDVAYINGAGSMVITGGNSSLTFTSTQPSSPNDVAYRGSGTGAGNGLYFPTANITGICTNSTEKLRVTSAGSLLIGTTTESARLFVKGSGTTSATTSLLVQNSAGTQLFNVRDDNYIQFGAGSLTNYNDNTGVFNIWDARPNYCKVTQDAYVSTDVRVGKGNSLVASNTVLGKLGLNAITTGGNNTAIGNSSLGNTTIGQNNTSVGSNALTTNITGDNNVAVGTQSLFSNVSGGQSTAVGYSALFNNTASGNTAFGYASAQTNTSGSGITAIGYASLQASTGSNNTAVGYEAGLNNTTGTSLVAIGVQSARANTTGSDNTSVGKQALLTNQTGNWNTALGANALRSTTSTANTGIGYQALNSTTTGFGNTSLGYASLYGNLTGDYSVAIGYESLNSNTASNNTALGYQSGYSNTSGTNLTAIGWKSLRASTGSGNTAVGYESSTAITTGTNNTSLGFQSLLQNTSGTYNVAIGMRSLYVSSTGTNNTAIGSLNSALNSTGSNNVSVGYGTHYSNNTGSSNTLVGYNAQSTNFDSCVVLGRDASSTASNQFVVGSASYNAGSITTEVNTSTKVWNVKINGTDYKILLA